jgi:hypothetical protein
MPLDIVGNGKPLILPALGLHPAAAAVGPTGLRPGGVGPASPPHLASSRCCCCWPDVGQVEESAESRTRPMRMKRMRRPQRHERRKPGEANGVK